jgi:hypothetical protein
MQLAANASRAGRVVFHGTDLDSARRLLAGEPLDAVKAAAAKIDGPPGFFLAAEYADAEYFALRRAPGAVLQYELSGTALEQLERAGLIREPIPPGKLFIPAGDELVVPIDAFDLFNQLRSAGEIVVTPSIGAP